MGRRSTPRASSRTRRYQKKRPNSENSPPLQRVRQVQPCQRRRGRWGRDGAQLRAGAAAGAGVDAVCTTYPVSRGYGHRCTSSGAETSGTWSAGRPLTSPGRSPSAGSDGSSTPCTVTSPAGRAAGSAAAPELGGPAPHHGDRAAVRQQQRGQHPEAPLPSRDRPGTSTWRAASQRPWAVTRRSAAAAGNAVRAGSRLVTGTTGRAAASRRRSRSPCSRAAAELPLPQPRHDGGRDQHDGQQGQPSRLERRPQHPSSLARTLGRSPDGLVTARSVLGTVPIRGAQGP